MALISASVNGCGRCFGATETLTSAHGFSSTNFFFCAYSQQAFIITIRSRTAICSSFCVSQSRKFSATVSETERLVLFLKNTETCFSKAVYLANVPFSILRRLYSTKRSNSSETEIYSCFWGLYFTREGSKLPLVMSSSIVLTSISAALRLGLVSGRPMYNQNRLPCHDHAKPTLTDP